MESHNMDSPGAYHVSVIDLPPEIVDHIFRYACITSTFFCLSLSQTSTWTRRLALPYLYSTLMITKLRTATLLRQVLGKTPINCPIPNFLPKKHVRSIWLESISNITPDIFRYCDALSNLALTEDNLLWIVDASSPSTGRLPTISERTILRKPDLHLLMVDAMRPDWSLHHLASPFFNKVTHMQIGRIGSYSTYLNLAHFTRMSHIAVPFYHPQKHCLDDLLQLFDLPSTMVLLVVILTDQLSASDCQKAVEWVVEVRRLKRPVWATLSKSEDLRTEWEEEARNGANIWDKAMRFTESLSQDSE